jgi:hypothetical protein
MPLVKTSVRSSGAVSMSRNATMKSTTALVAIQSCVTMK